LCHPAGAGQAEAAARPCHHHNSILQAMHWPLRPFCWLGPDTVICRAAVRPHSPVPYSVEMKTFLISVNASTASGPSSRPRPDCLKPPNGVQYRTDECEFTDRLPVSTPRATRIARPTLPVQMEPDRPYGESFAISMASASSANGVTVTTGPKISSV